MNGKAPQNQLKLFFLGNLCVLRLHLMCDFFWVLTFIFRLIVYTSYIVPQ